MASTGVSDRRSHSKRCRVGCLSILSTIQMKSQVLKVRRLGGGPNLSITLNIDRTLTNAHVDIECKVGLGFFATLLATSAAFRGLRRTTNRQRPDTFTFLTAARTTITTKCQEVHLLTHSPVDNRNHGANLRRIISERVLRLPLPSISLKKRIMRTEQTRH